MYYEKLALEVGATVAGFTVVKPSVIQGTSGNIQKFTFVASDGPEMYAFDVCTDVTQVEILRTYVKKMDTGAKTYVICLSGRPTPEAKEMARYYGIEILDPSDVGDFFCKKITQQIRSTKNAGTKAA